MPDSLHQKKFKPPGRITALVILLGIFLLPMLLAWMLLHGNKSWLTHTSNRGVLVQPPLSFAELKLFTANSASLKPSDLRGKWLMIYIAAQPCEKICLDQLHNLRQVWVALGKDMDRVQRLLITYPDQNLEWLNQLAPKDVQGVQKAYVTPQALKSYLANNTALQMLDPKKGAFLIVDPHYYLMMIYPPERKARDLLDDMTHLLSVSQIG